MSTDVYRFEFDDSATREEAEMTLHLATYAIEGLYGSAGVRLDVAYDVDEQQHVIHVDAATEVGTALVKVFTSLLLREFGEASFRVRRVVHAAAPIAQEQAA